MISLARRLEGKTHLFQDVEEIHEELVGFR